MKYKELKHGQVLKVRLSDFERIHSHLPVKALKAMMGLPIDTETGNVLDGYEVTDRQVGGCWEYTAKLKSNIK